MKKLGSYVLSTPYQRRADDMRKEAAANASGSKFSKSSDLQFFRLPTPKLAVQGRYNQRLHLGVSSCSLQGIAERPLPCNYYVIEYFHGGNTGSNPVGDAKPFQELASNRRNFRRDKKAQL